MTVTGEGSPCPYLDPRAFRFIFSPLSSWGGGVIEWLWWAPGIQPGSTHHTANSGHRHHGCRGANSFSKILFSPYVIQPLKASSWQWLLKRTPSATHPPGPSTEPVWCPPSEGYSVAGMATPAQNRASSHRTPVSVPSVQDVSSSCRTACSVCI